MKTVYLNAGTKVKGVHRGTKYTGVVEDRRPSYVNDSIIHYVKLDNPISYKLGDTGIGHADDGILIRTNTGNDVSTIEVI